jgi:hypothetical protein
MKETINSNENIEFIKKLYLNELSFNLENSENKGHAFYDNFQTLLKLEPKSDEYHYILYHCLFGPSEYLEEIKKVSFDDYNGWKNRLICNKKNVGLYGDIFELYINWTFVQKSLNFTKRERPDFSLKHNNKEIFIECTSTHCNFDKIPVEKDIFKKLKSKIRKKIIEEYMNLSTALFIDITNLYYHSKNINLTLNENFIFKALKELDDNLTKKPPIKVIKPFGAIVFFYFDNSKNSNNETLYSCNILAHFKRPTADTNLVNFLEENIMKNIEKTISNNPKFNH